MFTFLSNLSKANTLAESSINPFSSEYRKKKESLQEVMQQKMREKYATLPQDVREFGSGMKSAFAPIAKVGNTAIDTIKRGVEYENRVRPIREYLNNSFNEYGLNYDMIQRASPEVQEQFMSVMNQVGVEVPGYAEFMEQKRKQEEWNQKNFLQKTGETILNGVGGVMEQAPQVTANVLNFVGKAQAYANPVSYVEGLIKGKDVGTLYDEKIGNDIKNVAEGASNFVRKYGAYDPESTAAQVGKFGMDLGASLVGPNKLAPFAGASKLAKAGNIAAEGALIGGKFDVASKGEVTSDGLLYGAGGNLALAGAFKAGGTIKNSMTKKLPAKLTLNGLINPGKLDAVKKSLQIDEGVASPEDVGKWLINRIKPGDKESIAKQLLEHSEQSKRAVDDILAKISERVQNKSVEKALSQLIDDYARTPGNEAKADMLSGLLTNGQKNAGYTLSEMNQIKRELDQAYNMFKGSGDATAGLRAEGIRNIRADIRKTIEDVASKYGEDIRKLNNETAVARGLAEGIMKKDNADAVRELLSPFSGMATGGVIAGVGSIANGQDPATVMKNILIGGIIGKAGASTTLKTSLAKALNSLGKKEMSALETYLKSQAEKGVKAGMKGSAGKTGGSGGVNTATNSLISAGKKVAEKVLRQAKVPAFTPLKPSKKLLDGKTPLIKRENQKFPKNGESGGTNKKELSREFDLNRESSYRNTIADFYKKANKSTKISEDGTPYYIRVDDVKIEYKKPEGVKNRNFKRDAFQTNETFLLTPQEKLYEKTLDDVQLAKKEKGVIGNDPEVGDILITTDKYADKYMAHGPINNANVVATINRWEYKIKNRAGDPDVVNYIKPFPKNSSYGMLVGVRKDKDGNFVTTTYEPRTKIADLLKKEEGKGGIIMQSGKNQETSIQKLLDGKTPLMSSKSLPDGKIPLKPSKKLLDGKTPLKPSKPLPDGKTPLKPSKKLITKGESHTKSPGKRLLIPKAAPENKPSSTSIHLEDMKQVQGLYNEYTKKHTKQSTLVIDSDNVKKLFSDFDPKAPEKVHEISSQLSQKFFETALKDPKIKNVTFTMGGGGSGKSELIVQGAIERGDGLVLDGTGKNYKKLVANIEQAKKAGKNVKIEAVFIDFDKASTFNKKRDRTVPESILRETHKGYRESLMRLLKEHPELDVSLTVNTGEKNMNGSIKSFTLQKSEIIDFISIQKEL